jgi:hypothetical protein
MWPCLSCHKNGDLQGGSQVFDPTISKYRILQHVKAKSAPGWRTFEADNGPWVAGGPSPGFRIGFGDYFDCDSLPECGLSVMAWSETPNGLQPWQTWARVLDLCQCHEDEVDALEDEIDYLMDAYASQELPFPRTPASIAKFEKYIRSQQEALRGAQQSLRACRTANPLPTS